MQQLQLKTRIHRFEHFADFAREFNLSARDLVITNEFIYDPYMSSLELPCHFVMQEKYGLGEPSDEMMNRILSDLHLNDFDRIIGVGGGTVIDISKLFVLRNITNVTEAFEHRMLIEKARQLIILPTTCGTGSEVTNISIAEIKSRHTKMGLADDCIVADDAVLVPEFLNGLPFKVFSCSGIDAVIHAVESLASPKASYHTRALCQTAIESILGVFMHIHEDGPECRFKYLDEMLSASNLAGIAFGNTGVGAVHALSYPLGGKYHVPHGEANSLFFSEVFRVYNKKKPGPIIQQINDVITRSMGADPKVLYETVDILFGELVERKRLRDYGMTHDDIDEFTDTVLQTQQRLLANNYVELTRNDIKEIYNKLY